MGSEFYLRGRAIAETAWNEKSNLSTEDLIDLVNGLRCDIKRDSLSNEESNEMLDGLTAFFTEKEVSSLDRGKLNKDFKPLYDGGDYEGYIRLVDRLLPRIEDPFSERGEAISIPAGVRPHLAYHSIKDVDGAIGEIYLAEEGMHMYFPFCDIYSEESPDVLIEERVPLLYSKVVTSKVLSAIQSVIDPEHKNREISDTIQKCLAIENGCGNSLFKFLFDHGIVTLSIKDAGGNPRYCEDVVGDIANIIINRDGQVFADVYPFSNKKYQECEITPNITNYHWMLDDIKRAINVAIGKHHQ